MKSVEPEYGHDDISMSVCRGFHCEWAGLARLARDGVPDSRLRGNDKLVYCRAIFLFRRAHRPDAAKKKPSRGWA